MNRRCLTGLRLVVHATHFQHNQCVLQISLGSSTACLWVTNVERNKWGKKIKCQVCDTQTVLLVSNDFRTESTTSWSESSNFLFRSTMWMPSWRSYRLCIGMWIVLQTNVGHLWPKPLLEKLLQGTRELNFPRGHLLIVAFVWSTIRDVSTATTASSLEHQDCGPKWLTGAFAASSCSALGGVCVAAPHGSCKQLATHFGATHPPTFTPWKLLGLYVTLCFCICLCCRFFVSNNPSQEQFESFLHLSSSASPLFCPLGLCSTIYSAHGYPYQLCTLCIVRLNKMLNKSEV